MEVVRNRETHAGRSATVKMIMASQIMGPTCPAVTRCQITQPYVCTSLLPHLLASLSNRLGGTAPPTAREKLRPQPLNSTVYSFCIHGLRHGAKPQENCCRHVYSRPIVSAAHPRRLAGLARRSLNGMRIILRLHTHVGPQLRTNHRHTPRPRKLAALIEERDDQ